MPTIVAHTRQYPPHRWIGAELATHELLKYLAGRGWDCHVRVSEYAEMDRNLAGPHTPYGFDGVIVTRGWLHELPRADVVLHSTVGYEVAVEQAKRDGALRVMWLHGGFSSWQVDRIHEAAPDLVVYNSHSQQRGIGHLIDAPSTVLHPPVWRGDAVQQIHGDRNITLINTTDGKGAQTFYDLAAHMPLHNFLGVRGGHGQQIEPPDLPNLTIMPHGSYMKDIWDLTSVLLMPSVTESWGMVAVEAMHRGIPVIGSDIPGLSECLGWTADGRNVDGMLLVQLQDATFGPWAWAAVLRNVLADWDTWSARALARSEELDPATELAEFEMTLLAQMNMHKVATGAEMV